MASEFSSLNADFISAMNRGERPDTSAMYNRMSRLTLEAQQDEFGMVVWMQAASAQLMSLVNVDRLGCDTRLAVLFSAALADHIRGWPYQAGDSSQYEDEATKADLGTRWTPETEDQLAAESPYAPPPQLAGTAEWFAAHPRVVENDPTANK